MSKGKDAPPPVTGKPGIARNYGLLGDVFDRDEAGMALRAERAAKYERDMKPYEDAKIEAARGELVKDFKASPGKWPDGIDFEIRPLVRPGRLERGRRLHRGEAVYQDAEPRSGDQHACSEGGEA